MLVVLETLSPAERIAFVLHDMFAVPFDEIAPIVGRSPAAARQLASRARRRVQGVAVAPDDRGRTRRIVEASWPRPAMEISEHCLRCSIRTSCCPQTSMPCGWARRTW
jgi:hypothetical protein